MSHLSSVCTDQLITEHLFVFFLVHKVAVQWQAVGHLVAVRMA